MTTRNSYGDLGSLVAQLLHKVPHLFASPEMRIQKTCFFKVQQSPGPHSNPFCYIYIYVYIYIYIYIYCNGITMQHMICICMYWVSLGMAAVFRKCRLSLNWNGYISESQHFPKMAAIPSDTKYIQMHIICYIVTPLQYI